MTVLRVGGLFSGIGAHHSALERLRERHEGFEFSVDAEDPKQLE